MFACLYRPPAPDNVSAAAAPARQKLAAIAQEFSPRYEHHRDDLVSIDVSGLERLLGPARTIGDELRHTAAARGVREPRRRGPVGPQSAVAVMEPEPDSSLDLIGRPRRRSGDGESKDPPLHSPSVEAGR